MKDYALYLLIVALLAEAIYMRSPAVAISAVVLWGLQAAHAVMVRKNRDSDIESILATLASHKKTMSDLTKDITNVSERARTILGENF